MGQFAGCFSSGICWDFQSQMEGPSGTELNDEKMNENRAQKQLEYTNILPRLSHHTYQGAFFVDSPQHHFSHRVFWDI